MSPDYTLYVCTDRDLMSSATVEESVEKAILGGAGVIQLREKDVPGKVFYETAVGVKAVTSRYGIPLIVNDRIDIAMAVGAEGVHVGQSDMPCRAVRELVGPRVVFREVERAAHRHVNHAHDGRPVVHQGDVHGELPIALDEFLRAVQRVHNPQRLPRLADGIVRVFAFLAQHGDRRGFQFAHDAGMCPFVGNGER